MRIFLEYIAGTDQYVYKHVATGRYYRTTREDTYKVEEFFDLECQKPTGRVGTLESNENTSWLTI